MLTDSWLIWVGPALLLVVMAYEAIAYLIRNPRLFEAILVSGTMAAVGTYLADWFLNSSVGQAAASSQLGWWVILFVIFVLRVSIGLLHDLYGERQENSNNNRQQPAAAAESKSEPANTVTDQQQEHEDKEE